MVMCECITVCLCACLCMCVLCLSYDFHRATLVFGRAVQLREELERKQSFLITINLKQFFGVSLFFTHVFLFLSQVSFFHTIYS